MRPRNERMETYIHQLHSLVSNEDEAGLYDCLRRIGRLYSSEIPEIADCIDEAKDYHGTIFSNADTVSVLLEEYIETHKCIEYLQGNFETDEDGLNKLFAESFSLYNQHNLSLATEKLWDAFERLKTYYASLGKKQSANKVVDRMANGNAELSKMFDDEFTQLTNIGNSFRIRHHETNRITIADDTYDYLYRRCLALLYAATHALRGGDE